MRETGRARSFVVDRVNTATIAGILSANISREAHMMTDQYPVYGGIGWNFAAHSAVDHGRGEYVREGDVTIHTNTIEGFFSVFKRGLKGVYQHCSKKHLHRYMEGFDFRYSNRSRPAAKIRSGRCGLYWVASASV